MKNIKPILLVASLLLAAILVMQNTDEVITKMLFAEVRMPRAVLLFTTFALGCIVGVLVTLRIKRAKKVKATP